MVDFVHHTPGLYPNPCLWNDCAVYLVSSPKKKVVISYIPVFAGIGTAASVLAFAYLTWFGITNAGATFDFLIILIVVGIAAAATAALWAVLRYLCRWNYVSHPMYLALIGSHFLDSSATGYALDLHPIHYIEQHVAGNGIIELTGTAYSIDRKSVV